MEFNETRICRAIVDEPFHKVAEKMQLLTESGRDVNIRDSHGLTFLHYVIDHVDKFKEPRAVPVVYQLALAGVDMDAKNGAGDTCLHRVVRKEGAWRVLVALIRCGADPTLRNNAGQRPEDILQQEKPTGWQEMLHWLNKFTPGLQQSLEATELDLSRIERLLQSWCRAYVCKDGRVVSLKSWAKKFGLPSTVTDLLERYEKTNELVTSALAGSAKRVTEIASTGLVDVNTKDSSYQYHYPHSPEVAQPLLAAVWEQNAYGVIDALMNLRPNTSVIYSNHGKDPAKPLFFHVISGRPRPDKIKIAHRIVRGSELWKKNHKGQTLVFEAMTANMSTIFINALIQYGLDISSRDYKGRSPRDYAEILGESSYVECMDAHVLEIIKAGDIETLEHLVLKGYDHIASVLKKTGEVEQRLCEKLKDDRILKHVGAYVGSIPKIKRRIGRMFEALDEGDMRILDKMAEAQISKAQNLCGQTLLHRALLTEQSDVIRHITCSYSHLVNVPDNMLRTPLHYAHILYGCKSDPVSWLTQIGASDDDMDVMGLTSSDYSRMTMTTFERNSLVKEITEFESRVCLRVAGFEERLATAIQVSAVLRLLQEGDLGQVQDLMGTVAKHVPASPHSDVLFDCVDQGQPDIAAYLIKCGYNPDIWKQYHDCDPLADECVSRTGRHELVSLESRAKHCGYTPLANYISKARLAKTSANESDMSPAAAFQHMANFTGPS